MTTKVITKYIWRSLESARTAGWCALCEDFIDPESQMVILATGPHSGDWTRAHKKCAVDSDNVFCKPEDLAALEEVQRVEPVQKLIAAGHQYVASRPIVEPYTGGGASKYRVALGGKTVFMSSNRSRAEGAAELVSQMIDNGGLSI